MDRQAYIQKLESLSPKQKIAILLATILLVGGAYWYFSFNPKYKRVQALEKDISSLNQDIARLQNQLKKLPKLRAKLKEHKKELIYAKTLLPESSKDVENLLSQIEKLGNNVGVEFLLFAPGQERVHDFYASRSVKLRLNGPFHNLMTFFSEMSRLNRLVTLEDLQLKPNKKRDGSLLLLADSHISIYRTLSEKELTGKNKGK
jgi:type IV pilus assembly protein PilO